MISLAGFALGLISLVKIRRSQSALQGRGLALAGTILSGSFLIIFVQHGVSEFSGGIRGEAHTKWFVCVNNMKMLGLGARIYAKDHQGRLPPGDSWCDALGMDYPKQFLCPAGNPKKRCHYAYNAQLSGIETNKVSFPSETVMFFEIEGGWNVSGGPELMLKKPRHQTFNLIFVDGSVAGFNEERIQQVRW